MAIKEKNVLSRRQFLKLSGTTVSAAALTGGGLTFFSQEAKAAEKKKITETRYGVCGVCSMGCSYIAHISNGKILQLTGNPADQTAEGKLCVKGYSGIRLLYDKDRLKYPMKRTNPKKGHEEDPKWVKISWEEAYTLMADKFKNAIDKHGPESIAVVARAKPWAKHFVDSIGTPNLISHNNTCYSTQDVIWHSMVNKDGKAWTVDYTNSKYILSFGWDAPGKSKNHWGRSVNEALDKGAKLVVFDPRFSITASKAHEWIPIKPGTDLAVLLAMINVIISEKLYDKTFVAHYVSGFNDIKKEAKKFSPQWAAKISEVPADTIIRIAREFAKTKPAVVASHKRDAGGPNYKNSWITNQCFVILEALAGTIDRPGGHVIDRQHKLPKLQKVFNLPPYPKKRTKKRVDGMDKFPILNSRRKGSFSTFAEGLLSKKPNEIKIAFFHKHNILAFPEPQKLEKALNTIDFIVVHDILPNENTMFADLVLPDNTFYETKGLVKREYHAMYAQIALKEGIKPLYDTKGFTDISLEILRRIGLKQYAPKGMSGGALRKAQLKSLNTTESKIKASGGMWGKKKPLRSKTHFSTPSGKIEFNSSLLKKNGYPSIPTWVEPRAKVSAEFPFHYLIYRMPFHRMTQSQNDPILSEIYPENSVLIHTDTADKLGISTGDEVYVESTHGKKIKLKANCTYGIRKDCVAVDHGFGHWSSGLSVAQGKGANDGDLIHANTVKEQLDLGCPAMAAMMEDVVVKIYRA